MFDDDYEDDRPKIKAAVGQFEAMLKKHETCFFDLATYENMIEYYEDRNDFDKIERVLDFALEQYPYSSYFLIKKAGLELMDKHYRTAHELLDRAELLDPSELTIYILRSDSYLYQSNYQKSVEVLRYALLIASPESKPELLLELADVYEEWEHYYEVFDTLKQALTLQPENEEALSRMWYSVVLSGRFEESIEFHTALIDKTPYSYWGWYNLGLSYHELGMYEKAIDAFEFVFAINEKSDLAYCDCAESYFKLKNYKKAIEYFEKAIEFAKPYEAIHYSIGVCYEKLKDYHKARQYYRKAVAADSKFDMAHYRIGETYRKQKQWKNAIHSYERALQINNGKHDYITACAEVFYKSNDSDGLLKMSDTFFKSVNNSVTFPHVKKMMSYLFATGNFSKALDINHKISEEAEFGSATFYIEAAGLYALGKKSSALTVFEYAASVSFNGHHLAFDLNPTLQDDEAVQLILEQYKK